MSNKDPTTGASTKSCMKNLTRESTKGCVIYFISAHNELYMDNSGGGPELHEYSPDGDLTSSIHPDWCLMMFKRGIVAYVISYYSTGFIQVEDQRPKKSELVGVSNQEITLCEIDTVRRRKKKISELDVLYQTVIIKKIKQYIGQLDKMGLTDWRWMTNEPPHRPLKTVLLIITPFIKDSFVFTRSPKQK
ncbi:hypothetical protein AGOR_G00189730 [Albula goreensis]|uniref:Uncharacterized protein n=1 Tax=Albula goreensis TaxID=1534307 RepID=A0A8T3CUW5_9TELE|nr:hypothetical protein AGOR_G00189730 [Albula goreensis]